MKSTTRPVKKKKTGLAAISPTYWLIGIMAVMVALMLIVCPIAVSGSPAASRPPAVIKRKVFFIAFPM